MTENLATSQVSFEINPFFQDLQPLSLGLKSFYDAVQVVEGDIFEKCFVSWSQFRMFFLKSLYGATTKLEKHVVLTITMEIISEVAEMMEDVESVGTKIGCLDRRIREIHKEREHNKLV